MGELEGEFENSPLLGYSLDGAIGHKLHASGNGSFDHTHGSGGRVLNRPDDDHEAVGIDRPGVERNEKNKISAAEQGDEGEKQANPFHIPPFESHFTTRNGASQGTSSGAKKPRYSPKNLHNLGHTPAHFRRTPFQQEDFYEKKAPFWFHSF
jgi:hypothetical protein